MEGRYTGLLVLFFSTALFLPPLRSLFALGGRYEVREITPHVFVWIPEDIRDQDGDPEFSRAGTAGFIIAPEGVVVVDTTNNPIHARELLYEIRRRTDAPVKYVIDTDPEFDHTLGNEVFWDQEASIISTPAVLSELRRYQKELPARLEGDWKLQARMRGIHPTLPSQTFESELTLHLAGNEMKLLSFADRDLPANSAVYLPQAKVLFLGDLFENGFFPRVGSRNVGRWIEILRQFESWEIETYVPGHGPPGGKKELSEFRQFLEWLTSEVETSIHQGKSLDQVKTALRPLENYRWRAPELAPSAVEAVFSQLAGTQGAAPAPAKPANQ